MTALIFCVALFAVFITCLYIELAAMSKDDRRIEEEPAETETTPSPEEEEEAASKLIVTYPVPLDQDLQDFIVKTAIEHEVSPCVVFAVIGVESNFDPSLVGDNGHSWGLMQIYNSVHIARCVRLGAWNLLDPYQNVRVGIDYLAELLDEGKGIEWALSFYNGHGGEPCDYARTVLCNARQIFEGRRVHE